MSYPPPITAVKLRVSTGSSTDVQIFEQDIPPSALSGITNNSVQITNNNGLLSAFSNEPPGTIFNASIITTFSDDILTDGYFVIIPSNSNFVPIPLVLSNFGPFIYNYVSGGVGTFTLPQPSSNSNSPGAFTYSIVGTTGIASVSTNVVTILSAGTTTIRATQAAAGGYTSAYIDATLTVTS